MIKNSLRFFSKFPTQQSKSFLEYQKNHCKSLEAFLESVKNRKFKSPIESKRAYNDYCLAQYNRHHRLKQYGTEFIPAHAFYHLDLPDENTPKI